jgi:hypothetical protein
VTTIRLATNNDMRAIDSRNLEKVDELPGLYIPVTAVDIPLPPLDLATEGFDLMHQWSVSR